MTSTTGHLQWSVNFATGSLEATASKGGAVVATDSVKTAGAAGKLAPAPDRPSIAADGIDHPRDARTVMMASWRRCGGFSGLRPSR